MATETTLSEILTSFTTATDVAAQALPSSDAILSNENGISLFDTKNEIFLAYLQALALRNLNVIRSVKDGGDAQKAHQLSAELTKKLVEHRVYLERGVRPLEQKIKFQVDRVVKAADEEERAAEQRSKQVGRVNGRSKASRDDAIDEGGSEDDDDEDDEDDDEGDTSSEDEIDQASFRPNVSAMSNGEAKRPDRQVETNKANAVYRPPRISATVMPTAERQSREERKPMRSKTIDEYVANEYSTAPVAEPSIGSNIAAGGRSSKSHRQLKDEQERRNFEETNLVRLPKQSKKDLARKGYGRDKDGGFGGEEWRNLGASLDRITDLTRRKGKDGLVDRSRKRMATEDTPRGDGRGEAFEIKKRRLAKKGK